MHAITDVDGETLLSGAVDWAGTDAAATLAADPLAAVETEYPHYVGSVDSPDGPERPSERHPAFYGCFDWHSAVHSHWALVRGLRVFDDHPDREEIVAGIDDRLTPDHVAREVALFDDEPAFERPYGWGWLLMLAAELDLWDDPLAAEWGSTLAPLESTIVNLVEATYLPVTDPFRVGTHGNTAFALCLILDYARTVGNDALAAAAVDSAEACFAADRDYPVGYEPFGWDFLSPGLVEADLMRRVRDGDGFVDWVEAFLPDVTTAPNDSVLEPVAVDPDPDEGAALHLVGLNVSRAWCAAGVAEALGDHRFAAPLRRSAARHAEAGVAGAFTDDYAGSHWLSSFVTYLLTRNEGGIAVPA